MEEKNENEHKKKKSRMEMNNNLLARKHNNLNVLDDALPTQLLVTHNNSNILKYVFSIRVK